ncbi:phosphate acyltransferase [Candidatus Xianfuyuplasma coldseepsis]|uniref:Phosphate butyryltransferase n=1 Tax=Candidatus Xianfuyuplasma coldseepsis TaxID=2782163 RepID=A0A7L7KNJ7_9MOLU|nr:phosphate acyltransferase [Xianfuyuplasma coldseepsis]QMS84310.1 phosphate butyryltransferase [Xianfuyuplasma coldseepsis]
MFRNFTQVVDYARSLETKDLIVASPEDTSILIAINDAFQMGLIRPVLVGDKKKILDLFMELGISKAGYEIYNAKDKKDAALMSVKLVSKQENSILMKGLIDTITLLDEVHDKEHGLLTGDFLSHLGVIDIPAYHKLLFISDAAFNISPNEEEKIKIINNTLEFVTSLGIFKPKIALVSAFETVHEEIQSTVEAKNIVEQLRDDERFYIGGPMSIDIAVSHEAAETKGIKHVVAGDADVLIFPNIEAGNTFYKSTTFFANSTPVGIILGASNPIVLTSRSDSYKSKLYSIALAVVSTDIL